MSDLVNPTIGEAIGYLDKLTDRLGGRREGEDLKSVDYLIDLEHVGTTA